MRITTDVDSISPGTSPEFVDRVLGDENLGASSITLEVNGLRIRFEGIHSGCAMLFREDSGAAKRLVALDAFDQDRIRALVRLFQSDPSALVESIDWQEDEVSNWSLISVVLVVIVIAIVIFSIYQ
jgi:hypothetical protein